MADAAWAVKPADWARARTLGSALSISPVTAQLLINRGFADPDRARRFLQPRLAELRRPDGAEAMAGFAVAVERLARALAAAETIGVFGDYDVDGVTSCALLASFLGDAGGRVVARVARRDAGYGFGVDDAARFADAGCAVVVTCDCGTSDHDALAAARARGIDVIVVDHHQVPERDPEALALINPHQPSCRFPFKGLASVGVAFYLAAALRTRLRAAGRTSLPDPRALVDLVAVGTIADLAPLTDENRILVHHGIARLREAPRPGLAALARVAGLDDGTMRGVDISLKLAPRLNAPGRLGDAAPALALLMADASNAEARAAACEAANVERRAVQDRVAVEAMQQAEAQTDPVIVVAGAGWHAGVVGIVAAKLVDRFARPSVVIALDAAGRVGVGSARTVGGFHLHRALVGCADLLVRYGGHAAAAGLTVEAQHLGELRTRLSSAAREAFGGEVPAAILGVDAEIALDAVDELLAEEVGRLEPFGVGNPEPVLAARGVTLERARVVGENHLQVTLRDGLHARDGIGFRLADRDPGAGSLVRAAFVPEVDTFRGVRRVRVRLRDLSPEV
ncbi:MAG TPA: single-stranded-DNA-specific exonuclease RecJ [Polyangia bacterium]|nr:single-stranded-DNA-specific exonuclease RecJ [Polyangia bacterium]